jgi:hypothetical protein
MTFKEEQDCHQIRKYPKGPVAMIKRSQKKKKLFRNKFGWDKLHIISF